MHFIRITAGYLFGVKELKISQSCICPLITFLSIQLGPQMESASLEVTATSFDIL